MAKLSEKGHSEEDLPTLETIPGATKVEDKPRESAQTLKSQKEQRCPKSSEAARSKGNERSSPSKKRVTASPSRTVAATSNERQARKQTPLRLAHVNSLLLPPVREPIQSPKKLQSDLGNLPRRIQARSSPRKTAKQSFEYSAFTADLDDTLLSIDGHESFDDLSDFIVADSASEEELRRPRSFKPDGWRSARKLYRKKDLYGNSNSIDKSAEGQEIQDSVIDLTSPVKETVSSGPNHGRGASPQIRRFGKGPGDIEQHAKIKMWV